VEGQQAFFGAEPSEVPAMPFLRSASSVWAAHRQLLGRVLVDRQVHPEVRPLERVARLIYRHPGAQQTLVDQHLDRVDDRRRVGPRRKVDHRLGGFEREAALEHRTLRDSRLLPGDEQVPRPVDCGTQRGLARRGTTCTGKQREPVAHALDELPR
jgi:hypothetical protein